jgi:hypothetical protein
MKIPLVRGFIVDSAELIADYEEPLVMPLFAWVSLHAIGSLSIGSLGRLGSEALGYNIEVAGGIRS